MRQNVFVRCLFLLLLCFLSSAFCNDFIAGLGLVYSAQECLELKKGWRTEFSWNFGYGFSLVYRYHPVFTQGVLHCLGYPLYTRSIENQALKGHDIDLVGTSQNESFDNPERDDTVYYYAAPRQLEGQESRAFSTVEELALFMSGRRYIFYTGAGISIAAGIWGMKELMQQLGFTNGKLFSLYSILKRFDLSVAAFQAFCSVLLAAQPTPAHIAINTICHNAHTMVITENVDGLHKASGCPMFFSHDAQLKGSIENVFAEADVIICVGLSADDCGLLAYFKTCNTAGKIISIDLQLPAYLGGEDYFLRGDCQKILPQLADLLAAEKDLLVG